MRRKKKTRDVIKGFRKTGFIFVVVGTLILGFGLYDAATVIHLKANGEKATATITEVRRVSSGKGSGRSYQPYYRFTTRDGRTINDHSKGSASWYSGLKRGDTFDIYYEAADPKSNRLDYRIWLFAIMMIISGGIFTAIGCFLLSKANRYIRCRKLYKKGVPVTVTVEGSKTLFRQGERAVRYYRCKMKSPYNGEMMTFKSEPSFDSHQDDYKSGTRLTMYIDPNNPRDYFIDTSSPANDTTARSKAL